MIYTARMAVNGMDDFKHYTGHDVDSNLTPEQLRELRAALNAADVTRTHAARAVGLSVSHYDKRMQGNQAFTTSERFILSRLTGGRWSA